MLKDIETLHSKFGVNERIRQMSNEELRTFLGFRLDCIREELNETVDAYSNGDPEEIVDGLIDILVFTLGTLDLYDVDSNKAWKEVMDANLAKEVGIKPGRPNPFGLPDLVKPALWQSPSHDNNHGTFGSMFDGS